MQSSKGRPSGPQRFLTLEAGLIVLMAAGCLIRLLCLGQRPLWDDEAFTYFVSRRGIVGLFDVLKYDAQPPLFYMVEAACVRLLGPSEVALRLPSLLAGLGLVLLVSSVGTRLWNRQTGLLAGALAATCPLLIYQSLEARSYSVLALLLLSAAWCYWQHASQPSWKSGLTAGLLGSLAVWTHYFGVFVLLFGGLILVGRPWKRLPSLLAPLALNVMAFASLLPLLAQQQQRHGGKQFHPEGSLLGTLVRSFLITGTGGFPVGLVKAAAALVFFGLLLVAVVTLVKRPDYRQGTLFPLLLGGLIFSLLHLGLVLGRWPVRDSYLSLVTTPFLMLLAAGLRPGKPGLLSRLPLGLAVLVMVAGDLLLLGGQAHANPDYRWGAGEVSQRQPEGVILTRPWGDLACYAYYTRQWPGTAVFAIDPQQGVSEEALVVGRPLRGTSELIRGAKRLCVLGKTSGVPGFQSLDQSLRAAGYSLRESRVHHDIQFQSWERATSRTIRPASSRLPGVNLR